MKIKSLILALSLLVLSCGKEKEPPPFIEPPVSSNIKLPIPENGCYHSAFIEDGEHNEFENLAQKDIAIEMNFFGFEWTPDFPKDWIDQVRANDAIPHLTWMPGGDDDNSLNDRILNGEFDDRIDDWANQINQMAFPVVIRLAHEMNGTWYSWSGINDGGSTTSQYGDPNLADGPEKYIAMWRYIFNRFSDLGVNNVSWVWCPNAISIPNEPWNQMEAYYPGDDYVDWVGLDGYNAGTLHTWSQWESFEQIYDSIYDRLSVYNKPIMIGEYASSELGGDKAAWIIDAYKKMKEKYPNIKAVTWFHIDKEADWRINSSPEALEAYQQAIADDYFLSEVDF